MEDGLIISTADTLWRDAQPQLATPFFHAVAPLLNQFDLAHWPTLEQLNAIAVKSRIANARGAPIRFVTPTDQTASAMAYETQIASTGEIPTRQNFHDFFNAMQWLHFPLMKSAINQSHVERLQVGGELEAKARSRERDVLTMFDESGIIVASDDVSLLELLRSFQWKTLFVTRRHDVITKMRFHLVGHGLMEKSLSPFIGLTAKAMLLNAPPEADLDEVAAAWLRVNANLQSSRNLAPLPLLGIPGWDARNENPTFYDNTAYFRDGYTRDRTGA